MAQVWLITGASSEFGSALAETVLKAGHRVIVTARNPTKAKKSYPQIEGLGGHWVQLDFSIPDAQKVVADSIQDAGQIDVLVTAAGYSILGSIEDMRFANSGLPGAPVVTIAQYETHEQFNTNFYGPLRGIKAALPFMRQQRSGVIVNFSSIAGIVRLPTSSIYAASKFALKGDSPLYITSRAIMYNES
jgi:NAD(P)-dependent dehydrogenase (short-subunit alcohol dehydrogenase family)